MSKHRSSSDECCYPPMMYGYGGAYGVGTGCYGGMGIRWIYALLVLIVIVLQFGRRHTPVVATTSPCDDQTVVTTAGTGLFDGGLIDNSVLFIIVVFLLILCAGCWNSGTYGSTGYGGGYGTF